MGPLSVLFSIALASTTLASPALHKRGTLHIETTQIEAFAPHAPLTITENHLPLKRFSLPQSRTLALCPNSTEGPATQELRNIQGAQYVAQVQLNGQSTWLVFDTGSSDTWVVKSDFACFSQFGTLAPSQLCGFGPTFNGDFPPGDKLPDLDLRVNYGDGTYARGLFGFLNVTIAGLTVRHQQVALANASYWNGVGASSGLLGLAYPGLTSAFPTGSSTATTYDPLFTTMWKQGLSAFMFTTSLVRNGTSYVSFGGLPPVITDGKFASTPITMTTFRNGDVKYGFYSITPDAFSYDGAAASQPDMYIVDSGTTLTYINDAVVDAVAKQFNPPAIKEPSLGNLYTLACNAKAPDFGIKIGGRVLTMTPENIVLQLVDDTGAPLCVLGIQPATLAGFGSGGMAGILGETFMNSLVVVHDVGAAQMRFSPRL
ncbi:acid protease [Microthyrium microscopicum]|uniref:Acid protease n=1 Tax=Microthyrium microscopicum TaxID=703497 RepID=A0A6A6UED8_9PEZI|nr:acid protease [Microthyrium microscopicum]